MVSYGVQLNFMSNSAQLPAARYLPSTKTVSFRGAGNIEYGTVGEELYHAYQDAYYSGLPTSHANGSIDIEFEAKVFNFLSCKTVVRGCYAPFSNEDINQWLLEVSVYGDIIPSWDMLLARDKKWGNKNYWDFLQEFAQTSGDGYTGTPVYRMPNAMIAVLNQGTCN